MRTKGFRWDIDENKRNLLGTVWELDWESVPDPSKTFLGDMLVPPNWCSSHALS
jgi:hypothetical protein